MNLFTKHRSFIKGKGGLVIAMLNLLGGDIALNPGPKKIKYPCSACNKEVKKNHEALKCPECNKWTHRTCSTVTKENYDRFTEKKFVWICPTPQCSPTCEKEIQTIPTSLNPFKPLADLKITERKPKKTTKKARTMKIEISEGKLKRTTKQSESTKKAKMKKCEDNILLKQLTKIKPKEYQGHHICNECNKRINEGTKRMECIECERCTHRKCANMKAEIYNKERNFWTCKKCLEPEDLPENLKFSHEDFRKIDGSKIETIHELVEMKSVYKNSKLWIHFNCRSLNNSYGELEIICNTLSPDYVFGTESWMDESNPPSAYIPKGYMMKRKDRSDEFKHKYGKERGGGVFILHKENLNVAIMPTLNTTEDETLWVKVKDKEKTALYSCIYRTSYCDLLEGETNKLETSIVKASALSRNIMLFGDFNCDLNATTPDKATSKLTTTMQEMNLHQSIKGATRIESGKPKLLDHIWAEEQMTENIEKTGICTGISDHAGIYAFIRTSSTEEEKVTCRNYKNYKKEQLCEDLSTYLENSEFQSLISSKEINKATVCWIECLQRAIEKNAPMKTFTKRNDDKVPWFNEELKRLIERKNSMLQLWYLNRRNEDRTLYRKLKNQVNHLKRRLKSDHYSSKIEEYQKKPRMLWNLYKEITGNTKQMESIEPDFMDKEKANEFNNFFATVGSKIQEKLHIEVEEPELPEKGFEFKEETEETIIKLIKRIRSDLATGNDNINARFIIDAAETITPSLTQLVNLSYKTNTFPDVMKEAIVRPIFKKEDKEKPEFYRPVSILPVVSKVFERSATNQLIEYLEKKRTTLQHTACISPPT